MGSAELQAGTAAWPCWVLTPLRPTGIKGHRSANDPVIKGSREDSTSNPVNSPGSQQHCQLQ